jgi:hypothetical protein
MKNLLSYAIALVFSLSVATATYAKPIMGGDHKTCCGDHEKGKKMSKKECKQKCKSGEKKACCSHSGSTSKK